MANFQYTADLIRAHVFAWYVAPDYDAELATFTVGEVRDKLPYVQQQQILGATTARGPLAAYGITATTQGGFHANRDHEILWRWEAAQVRKRFERLDNPTRLAVLTILSRGQ